MAVLARVAAIGMTFVFSLVVGRALGTGSAGLVFTAVVVVTLLSTAGRLGVDLDAMKRAARLHDVGGLTRSRSGGHGSCGCASSVRCPSPSWRCW